MNQAAGFARTSEPPPVATTGASPEETLRTIAHQLRQPLSSIESIAFYLSMLVPHKDERIQQQLRQIRMLVENANRIIASRLNESLLPADERAEAEASVAG